MENLVQVNSLKTTRHDDSKIRSDRTDSLRGKTENSKTTFQPNIKLLYRIAKAIMENSSLGKTAISQKANINYVILMKHLTWLDAKGLIESVIYDGKVHVRFREKGRQFADQLIKLVEGELNFIVKQD